jgi:hypothetical protein
MGPIRDGARRRRSAAPRLDCLWLMENPFLKPATTAVARRKGLPPWLVPGNPDQRGKPKPGSGRRPDRLIEHLEATLDRPETLRAIEAILANPDHPHFAKVLTLAIERVYGRPEQRVAVDSEIVVRWE